MMRAIVYRDFGSPNVLKPEDVEKPTPADNEVLVAVHAASVNMFDWYMVRGKPALLRPALGLATPKPLGVDLSGIVEAVGQSVTEFKPGDRVFGTGRDKGLRSRRGAFAEYVSTPARALAIMPGNATFAQAAGVPMAGLTALQGLRDHGRIQRGQKVLINGASGGIGTFAVQIAKAFGADVTGVCSTRNAEHGAIDRRRPRDRLHTRELHYRCDTLRRDPRHRGQPTVAGVPAVLTDSGKYVLAGGPPARGLRLMLLSPFTSGRLVSFVARSNPEDLNVLRELIESGAVTTVIDRSYSLEETSDAVGYVAAGHTRGKVVIAIGADTEKRA